MSVLKWGTAIAAMSLAALVTFRCANINPANTSEVGNPKLSGHLADGRNGNAAQGATVRIYPVYQNKMAQTLGKTASGVPAIDSTLTDRTGYYRFDSLEKNVYSIEGRYIDGPDTLTMRHPSVMFIESIDLGCDTLRLPGWIKGKVIVTGSESPKNITCYIPGTSYIAITNDTGGFRITGIPAGTYSLSFTSARFNDTSIYGLKVAPNHETNAGIIGLGLDLSKNEHDVWGMLDSSYDCKTIARVEARLSGDSIPLDSPRIYKLDWRPAQNGYSGFIFVPDNGFFWTVDIWVYDTAGHRTGAYRVPIINRATGDVEVPNFNPFNSVPVISLHDTTVSINDTIRLRPGVATLADDSIVSMEWKIGNSGTFLKTTKKDTLILAPGDSGIIPCIFKVTDKFGNTATDTIVDSVITDPPVPSITILPAYDSAGKSITLPLGTKITYKASVRQRFGSVDTVIWSYQGTSSWGSSGIKDSGSITFDRLGEQRLICRARDDDGNEGADTLNILIVTVIGGILPMNSVLRESGSPYVVKQNLVVQTGGKWTIEPGTILLMDPGVTISVYGSLDALGTSLKKIVFNTNSLDTLNSWAQLIVYSSSVLKLKFCDILGGAIYTPTALVDSIIFDSCTFKNTGFDIGGSAGLIRGCVFYGCFITIMDNSAEWLVSGNHFVSIDTTQPCGLFVPNSHIPITISSNHFTGGGGIEVNGNGVIINNTIENSIGNGILSGNSYGPTTIINNTISNCSGTGILLYSGTSIVSPGNLARTCRHNSLAGNGFGTPPFDPPYNNAGIICTDLTYTIDSNIVTNNNIGIICTGSDVVTNNNILNNTDYNFRVLVNDVSDVTAPNNWWGTTDTTLIQSKIYDYSDDPGVGRLLIDPIATDSIPGAGPR